ncbi:MAG: tyrosine-type recombinase/integrase [Bacteriovoracaceae bacterium]|nr:tyrosine-type recombinase/integrase [Bacteriovoracaceae bacterium]
MRKIIKTMSLKANIQKRVYPHLFRHSLASNLLKPGAGIILIKEQLGHAFIDSTMIYVQSLNLRTKTKYDYFKPAYM